MKIALIYFTISFVTSCLGDYAIKMYHIHNKLSYGITALTFYIVNVLLWFQAFEKVSSLTILGTMWCVMYAIAGIFVGMVWFNETPTPIQYVGLVLAVSSIILLSI